MVRHALLVAMGALLLLVSQAVAQQVIISDFPVGIGGSVDRQILQAHSSDLRSVADTLKKYPLARAIVTGGADAHQYRKANDGINPGLALGRAHLLRSLLIQEFGVDSTQIVVQSKDSDIKSGDQRFASIRIDRTLADLESRLAAVEQRPPVEKHIIEQTAPATPPPTMIENMGLRFGIGGTTSPFGGMPIVTGAVTWKKKVYVETFMGHTLWNDDFGFEGENLRTKNRMIGVQAIVNVTERFPVGAVVGWVRIEEISREFYKYVKLSEGPMFGARVTPLEWLSVTGTWNPSKHRRAGNQRAHAENDQFLLSVTAHLAFGGAR